MQKTIAELEDIRAWVVAGKPGGTRVPRSGASALARTYAVCFTGRQFLGDFDEWTDIQSETNTLFMV